MDTNNQESINLGGFNDLIKMRDGWMIYNKNDIYIGKSIKEYGEWSQGEIDLFEQILNPIDTVIEVGSNIGSHTLAISKIVHKGFVFAFEPQRIIFQNLCSNISINSITNCFCFESGLSDTTNEQFYYPDLDYSNKNNFAAMNLTNERKKYTQQANIDTLDNRFANLKSLKLLKTDAEGMEVNIIKGGINLIKRTSPLLYVENSSCYIDKSQELIELIWSLGYRLFWHIVPIYNKNNFFNNTINVFGRSVSCNMFGVKKDQKINTALTEVTDSYFHPYRK